MTSTLPQVRAGRAGREDRRGFTLVEALVSLFVFGLVSSLVLAVIDLETRLDRTGTERDARTFEIVQAQTLLRRRIEQTHALNEAQGFGDTLVFYGSARELTFVAPPVDSQGPHMLQQYRIALSPRRVLTLYSAPTLSGIDPQMGINDGWKDVALVRDVDWIQIDYFGKDRITRRDMWQVGWSGRRDLPKLVRLRIGFPAGDGRTWPTMMVKILSGQTAPCPSDRNCGADT
ncbi:PulJ/GspJ family protein [Novosphingobium huizhouense]|uniref:PulJ/GspJ family protein n=1 Tax=Novosphingobium huizhouense TaxID=2866625 RepID=UPI001CD9024A|nr:prepilin-type N-terminal cleavage/methylation domain-containing protein [Novosphingobium huizhouense]